MLEKFETLIGSVIEDPGQAFVSGIEETGAFWAVNKTGISKKETTINLKIFFMCPPVYRNKKRNGKVTLPVPFHGRLLITDNFNGTLQHLSVSIQAEDCSIDTRLKIVAVNNVLMFTGGHILVQEAIDAFT